MTRALTLIACCAVVLALGVLALGVLAPASAWAKPRVALAPLDKDPSGDVQDAVAAALGGGDGELVVVSPKKVGRTIEKLGLEGEMSEKDAKKLANELDADAVVLETLSTKDGTKTLHFKLFVHGKKQKGFRIEFASAKSKKFRAALHDKMVSKLGDTGDAADDDADTSAKPASKKKKAAAASDDDDAADTAAAGKSTASKKKKAAAAASDDDDSDASSKPVKKKKGTVDASVDVNADADADAKPAKQHDVDADSDTGNAPAKKKVAASGDDDDSANASVHASVVVGGGGGGGRAANRAAVRLDVGESETARTLKFNGPPPNYKNTVAPGVRVEGELYPLAFGGNSVIAGFGVAGLYDKTFGLDLVGETNGATDQAVKFPVEEYHWEAGLRYRFVFGGAATAPSLTLGVDYGHQQFKVNFSGLMAGQTVDVPSVEYVGVTPNVQFRLPLGRPFALLFRGGSMFALRAGEITQANEYGAGKLTSANAAAGFEVIFTRNLGLRVLGEFAQYGIALDGTGTLSSEDGKATVGGTQDRYFGGAVTLAGFY